MEIVAYLQIQLKFPSCKESIWWMCIQLSMCGGGLNPTLTYRTVLGKKRNTKIEKNQKNFRRKRKARWTQSAGTYTILKMSKKIETYNFSVIGLLRAYCGGYYRLTGIYTFSNLQKERKWRGLESLLENLHLYFPVVRFISLYCERFSPKVSLWGSI